MVVLLNPLVKKYWRAASKILDFNSMSDILYSA
jgi:hypothetical protein